jgi:RNA polymerase beta subunit
MTDNRLKQLSIEEHHLFLYLLSFHLVTRDGDFSFPRLIRHFFILIVFLFYLSPFFSSHSSSFLPPPPSSTQYSYIVKFGEIYVTPPSVFEADGHSRELYPQEARLRSLTYASPVFIGE